MIPKIYKLKLRKIAYFFKNCERYYSRYFLVFYQRNNVKNTKLVVVVPKKTVKLRVNRSKMKRQIYNLSLPLLRKSTGLNLVLVINKKIITATKIDIARDLSSIFLRLNNKTNE